MKDTLVLCKKFLSKPCLKRREYTLKRQTRFQLPVTWEGDLRGVEVTVKTLIRVKKKGSGMKEFKGKLK